MPWMRQVGTLLLGDAKMTKYLLVKFDSNYADEFDVSGFTIMSQAAWEKHKVDVAKRFAALSAPVEKMGGYMDYPELEAYFGTNESLTWSHYDHYIESFDVKELSDDELKVLKKFFGMQGTGMVVMLDAESDEE